MKKVCKKCNKEKELDEFCKRKGEQDGHHRYCKECQGKEVKVYYENTKDNREDYYKSQRIKNKAYHNQKSKEHFQNNKEKYNEYWKQRIIVDPTLKIRHSVNSLINIHLKGYQLKKSNHTIDYLGCDMQTYHQFLEDKFDSNMSWDNYGTYWEIDHIIPIDSFDLADSQQLYECFNYKNTRPLNITENKIKSNNIY